MSQRQRLIFLSLALLILVGVGFGTTGSFQFLFSDFWFSAGLLMLILLSVVDQPHFSRDANVFINGVAAMISLVAVVGPARTWLWYVFLTWSLYLVSSSYAVMIVRSRQLSDERLLTQIVSRVNRSVGRPHAIFSAFFLWGIFSQFGENSIEFRALLLFWAIFIVLNLPGVSRSLADSFMRTSEENRGAEGVITSFLSPRVFECRLRVDSPRLDPGTATKLHNGDGEEVASALVIDDRVLPHVRYAKLAITETTKNWALLASETTISAPYVRLTDDPSVNAGAAPVGVVDRGTDIGGLRLLVNPQRELEKGEVLRVDLADGSPAFFQIVAAKVAQQAYESSQMLQTIDVTAGQLGLWHEARCRFEPANWVAPAGGLVFKVDETDHVAESIPEGSTLLGRVPNSSFPVHLDLEDAVTHNTAVIGVTGSGKTYLTLHIIEALISRGVRVLVLDISRQHWIFLKHLSPFALKRVEDIEVWLDSNQSIGVHQFADASSYPARTADLVSRVFARLESEIKLKAGENEPARLCVVFEEAHSLIPEWNQVAAEGDKNQVNKTARSILQGRKYGLGCLLVTQRTANVTKTILNQCNTIFALQSFDQTGLDFLKNYMGDDYARAISTLPVRHAILVGKASSSTRPILFGVTDFAQRWTERDDEDEAGNAGGES